jgi:glycosyltransferase involved in cell wall biosynthesis
MHDKILIIAYHFPPLNSVASSRTYAFAKYLAEMGAEVTVVAPEHQGDGCNFCPDYSGDLFRIVRAGVITNNNRNFSLLGGGSGFADRLADLRFRMKKWISYRIIGNLFTQGDLWGFTAAKYAFGLVERDGADVVISSFSPICSHLLALGLKRKFPRLFWVADYRDLWSLNECVPRPVFPLSLIQKRLEAMVNLRADCIVTVSQPLRLIIERQFHSPVYVVENGYFPSDIEAGRSIDPGFTRKFTFSATGAIYRGKRDPMPFFNAISQLLAVGLLQISDIEVRFYGENSYLLKKMVSDAGLEEVVRLLPLVSREESLAVQKKSAGLLFLEADDPVSRGFLTGKLFEYLVSGQPIIAVGITGEHEAARVIQDTGTGYICGTDVGAIKQAILKILGGAPYSPDLEKIGAYRRDRLVLKLAGIIGEVRNNPVVAPDRERDGARNG